MVTNELARRLYASIVGMGGRYAMRLSLDADSRVHMGSLFNHVHKREPYRLVPGDARLRCSSGAIALQAVAVDNEA